MEEERADRADLKADKARAKALRPWYKKKRFMIPIVLLGLAFIASVSGGSDSSNSSKSNDSTDGLVAEDAGDASQDRTPGMNQPVRDGKFEFTVTGIQCGQTTVGGQYLNKTAQGQFCLLNVHVKNIGNEAQTMFGDNQTLIDSQRRKYSADTEAAIYDSETKSIFEEINPGNELDGRIYFDVPKGVVPTKVELHDSAFSGGVTVRIG